MVNTGPVVSSTANPESSIKASSFLKLWTVPVGLLHLNPGESLSVQFNVTSEIAAQKCGEPPLPCPVPNYLCSLSARYSTEESP